MTTTQAQPLSQDTAEDTARPTVGQVGTIADPATASLPRPGALPDARAAAAAAKDKVLCSAQAIELAQVALGEITEPLSVGAHVASRLDGERLVTHLFDCNLAGYRGWRWAVTMTRPPRARSASICEMELLPGEDAILAPEWIPWADRLQPGDVSRSDRLPKRETDERLQPGWEATEEHAADAAGTDALDFGRPRVLSPEGVQRAAQRWYDGDHGPDAVGVRKAHATCSTCGFFVPLAGPLRNVFGLCANEWAEDDGRVVSLDHGCGAHSETDLPDQGPDWPITPSRMDDSAVVPIGTDGESLRDGRSQEEVLAEAEAERAEAERAEAEKVEAERADAEQAAAEQAEAEAQAEAQAETKEVAGKERHAKKRSGTKRSSKKENSAKASSKRGRSSKATSKKASSPLPDDEQSRFETASVEQPSEESASVELVSAELASDVAELASHQGASAEPSSAAALDERGSKPVSEPASESSSEPTASASASDEPASTGAAPSSSEENPHEHAAEFVAMDLANLREARNKESAPVPATLEELESVLDLPQRD